MAFHVACPITCQRICFCALGFGKAVQSEKAKKGFLEEIVRVEEFLTDPWSVRSKDTAASATVQVLVPKVVPPPPPPPPKEVAAATLVGDGSVVGGETEEMLSLHSKRIALQKRAIAASAAAEDYVRKFETGALAVAQGDAGEAVHDVVGEDQGVKVMCRICFDGEDEGSDRANRMLPCRICNRKYHRSCLKSWGQNRDLFHLSSWVCPTCRNCEVCRIAGDATKFMFCKRCDGAYHCYCLPYLYKKVSNGPYLCPKHTRCHSCGSNVPGNGPSTRWFLGYTCCDACGRLFVKGNYCPVCLKVYRDSESTPMVCCDVCQRWVHCQCDGISDEKYLQFQADGNLLYKCAACRGECYQVTGPDDAVQELWRRRDRADRDQIASLRAAAGLPSEEEFSISIYSDDDDYSPYGRSLKFSVKGSAHKGTKNNKEHGKKSSNKKSGNKKGSHVSLIGKTDGYQSYEGLHSRESVDFNLSDSKNDDIRLYRSKGIDTLSSRVKNLGNTGEQCSVNQAGITKHNFVEELKANNARAPKISHIKSSKSNDPVLGFGFGKNASNPENVKGKKLVIHLGARNKNLNNSPKSEASSCHKEQDATASNGSEDTGHQKVNKKYSVDRNDGAARIHDGKGEKSGKTEPLTYSRNRDGGLIKLAKAVKAEGSELNSQTGKRHNTDGPTAVGKTPFHSGRNREVSAAASERVTGAPTLRTEDVPLRRHSKGKPDANSDTHDNSKHKASNLVDLLPKDPKPLLKLKFKKPYLDSQSSLVPQEEEKSSIKGQRSKRKRPEKNHYRDDDDEEEAEQGGNTQGHQESPVSEAMDANWILKKLGKDAIGKRVEVHQPSDSSWHKGEVTDMIQTSSTIVVCLDDGGTRTLELGKQGIRFVSQKQKRSKTCS